MSNATSEPSGSGSRSRTTILARYPLSRPARMSLSTLARRSGVHPELLHRFVALGLLDATRGSRGELWFGPDAPGSVARIQRLRMGLGLNYAAVGVVLDLLDRIHELETRSDQSARRSDRPWTSIG
jgi:chaperone modulatory protein CbpM